MEPDLGTAPFDDPDYRFEPWWPGSRVLLFVERGEVRPVIEQLVDPLAAFPELRGVGGLLGEDGVIIDGSLLVLDADGRPDADLLRERLAYPEVRNGEAAFVASDLVWAGGVDLTRRPFSERLERLTALLRETDWCMVARGYVGRGPRRRRRPGLDGPRRHVSRHLGSPYRRGPSAGAWLRVPVVAAVAPDRRPDAGPDPAPGALTARRRALAARRRSP